MTGELIHQQSVHQKGAGHDTPELPDGSVYTLSGRVSAAADLGRQPAPRLPFTSAQLGRLDEALTLTTRYTRLRFSIYLGDLGEDSHAAAVTLHDQLGVAAADSVLIAVDPGRRHLDIVTGSEAHVRLSDRACDLAAIGMAASFKEGDLLGGLLSGLRTLSDHAGQPS